MATPKSTTPTETPVPEKKQRKARTPKVLSAIALELLTESKSQSERAKATAKEAVKISKLIDLIGELSEWGLHKVRAAIGARVAKLSEPPTVAPVTDSAQ